MPIYPYIPRIKTPTYSRSNANRMPVDRDSLVARVYEIKDKAKRIEKQKAAEQAARDKGQEPLL